VRFSKNITPVRPLHTLTAVPTSALHSKLYTPVILKLELKLLLSPFLQATKALKESRGIALLCF
jgi:hypothetical protein